MISSPLQNIPPGLSDDFEYYLFLVRTWNEENAVDVLEWIHKAERLARGETDFSRLTDALVEMPGMPSPEVLDRINGLHAVDKRGQCLWNNDVGKMVVVPLTRFEEW